jgi:hypothetical protein
MTSMKSFRHIAFLALGFAALSAHAQYKCQVDGKTVFQQMPCAGNGGQKLDVKPASGAAPAASEAGATDWSAVLRSKPASAGNASSTASDPAPCPTPQQLREMEYEASKIANRDNGLMQYKLGEARRCR